MEFGNLWDLAVIDSKEEMDRVLSLTKCQHNAFWIGAKKPWVGSGFKNVFSDSMSYSPVSFSSLRFDFLHFFELLHCFRCYQAN